jgi:hypothetical protein
MTYLAAAISLALFVWSLRWSRAVEAAGSAVALARSAIATLLDATLSDEEKERAARASSLQLGLRAVAILARFALAAAVPLLFLLLLIAARVLSLGALVGLLESWEFIAASSLVIGAALFWRR